MNKARIYIDFNEINVKIKEKLSKAILSYHIFDKQYDENLHRFMDVNKEFHNEGNE